MLISPQIGNQCTNMKKYQPSNGSEGCAFMDKFCEHCVHEKFSHTGDRNDKCCDILSRSMAYDIDHPKYPEEWIYPESGSPVCTAHVPHDWIQDEYDNWNDPEIVKEPEDPNQIKLPFEYHPVTGDLIINNN